MQVDIKLIDKTLPLPEYKTPGAVCFDLYSRTDVTIPPKSLILIPLNVIIKIPKGYFLLMAARSSLPVKKGLMAANSIGIFDEDFCGENDEWRFEAYNFTESLVEVKRGERIAQATLIKFDRANFNHVERMSDPSRGGIGSTG
ncbi:dUTP diphosphatase [Candidatus Kuenenbacteria bacterium]|nr:dUTP diphosphatase [Candidatus Kuenenbacteria bacterium]